MRTTILAAALALSAALPFAPVPGVAGDHGWHGGGGYWSLPAGARFARTSPGVAVGTSGLHGHHRDFGFFGGRAQKHGWSGGRSRDPVFVSPSFGRSAIVLRGGRGFVGGSTFGVRQFDRVGRTVVMVPAGGETSLMVKDWAPVPRHTPWPQSRTYLRFSWD
jgi:hypothetical protein